MNRALLLILMLGFPGVVFAEAGRTVAGLLTRTLGARAAGLGQSLTADAGEVDTIFFNPAGLARISNPLIAATYQNGLVDDKVGVVSYAHATGFGAWYVSAGVFDAGKIDLNQSDGTTGSINAQQDLTATTGLSFGKYSRWSAGFAVKYYRSELAETATADAVMGDAGLSWETPVPGFRLAAAVQNAGADLQYEVEEEPLPTTGRAGASYTLDLTESVKTPELLQCRYLLLVDGVKTKYDTLSYNAGLEIRRRIETAQLPGWAALRLGYIENNRAFTAGIGFEIWRVMLDYGINVIGDLDNTHRVTLGYRFASQRDVL